MIALLRDVLGDQRLVVRLLLARWLAWWHKPTWYAAYRLAVAEADAAERSHDYDWAAWNHHDAARAAGRLAAHDVDGVWRMLAEGHRQSADRCHQLAAPIPAEGLPIGRGGTGATPIDQTAFGGDA